MQLTPTEYKVLILVIGAVIGLAISFLAYSVSDSPVAFIFLPICIALVYFQAVHPIGKK